MKRLFLMFVVVCSTMTSYALTFVVNNLQYSTTSSNNVSLIGVENTIEGTLTIPERVSYNGRTYTVTAIGEEAFYECDGLTGSLTIPNSVTSIGDYAFYKCSGFTGSLTLSNNLRSIGVYAFQRCFGFTGSLTIPNSVTSIGENAFQYCSGFTGSLTIGNNVTSIGYYTFDYCSGFTGSLTIPNSVTSIGIGAFEFCTGFNGSLTIGNSVTTIDENAFLNCTGFTGSLTLPNSVTSIGSCAFEACSGFTGILMIGNNVSRIGSQVFYDCSGFTSVSMTNIVPPTIGDNVFPNTTPLFTIYVPCGYEDTYKRVWSDYEKYICSATHILTIDSEDDQQGFVRFTQRNTCDNNEAIIEAVSRSTGYVFEQWSDGNTDNPRTIMVDQDKTLSASFRALKRCTITISSDDSSLGTVRDEDGRSIIGVNAYYEGDTITLQAYPFEGGVFVQWSDGNIDNPRTIIVDHDMTLIASFRALTSYTVTINSNDESLGIVTDDDGWSTIGTHNYYEGTMITLQAQPFEGCNFVQWSDENTDNPRTIVVDKDLSLTAYFQKIVGGGGDEDGDEDGDGNTDGGDDTPVEDVPEDDNDAIRTRKVLRDGQLFILRDGEEYSITGCKLRIGN